MSGRLVQVYRGSKREEMYLYVDLQRDLADVPDELLAQFGELSPVMSLNLTPQHRLARVDAASVLEAVEAQGYYLQLPPTPEQWRVRNDVRD